MPRVPLTPLSLGASLPRFRLPEPLTGRLLGADDYPDARAILVAFLVNGCPEVQRVAPLLADLALEIEPLAVQVLAVNSADDDAMPGEAPADVAAEALRRGYIFPYLIDQTQAVARAFGVSETPDFYLFGVDRKLAYHGQLGQTRRDGLRDAIVRNLQGRAPAQDQVASKGCTMRWRDL